MCANVESSLSVAPFDVECRGLARTGGIPNAPEEITVAAMPPYKPAVRTFGAFMMAGSAMRALKHAGGFRDSWHPNTATDAGGQVIAAHEIVLASVPYFAIAGRDREQPPSAFAARHMNVH